MSREPRVHEEEITQFLRQHLSLDAMAEFYDRFGGYRIPKRSRYVTHKRNERLLIACLIRTVDRKTSLSEVAVRAVAEEFGLTPKAVRNMWSSWNRTGRPRVKKQGTTAATAPDTYRW